MDASERFEQLIAFLTTHLPKPVEQDELDNGILIFTGGQPGEVVARLTHTSVIVEEFGVRWEGRHRPVVQPRRVGTVNWRRLPETAVMNVLGELIKGAQQARLARYRTCLQCGESTPPEWMRGAEQCRDCAEQDLGLVH